MPTRYFINRLEEEGQAAPAARLEDLILGAYADVRRAEGERDASIYTGSAGIAFALWHCHQHASALSGVVSEEELLGSAERLVRDALASVAGKAAADHHGWSFAVGQAGVFAVAALCLGASADLAARQGRHAASKALRSEQHHYVQQYVDMHTLACSTACQEDEVLYGRAGYLLGLALLWRHLAQPASPQQQQQQQQQALREAQLDVVRAIISSGREVGVGWGGAGVRGGGGAGGRGGAVREAGRGAG